MSVELYGCFQEIKTALTGAIRHGPRVKPEDKLDRGVHLLTSIHAEKIGDGPRGQAAGKRQDRERPGRVKNDV